MRGRRPRLLSGDASEIDRLGDHWRFGPRMGPSLRESGKPPAPRQAVKFSGERPTTYRVAYVAGKLAIEARGRQHVASRAVPLGQSRQGAGALLASSYTDRSQLIVAESGAGRARALGFGACGPCIRFRQGFSGAAGTSHPACRSRRWRQHEKQGQGGLRGHTFRRTRRALRVIASTAMHRVCPDRAGRCRVRDS